MKKELKRLKLMILSDAPLFLILGYFKHRFLYYITIKKNFKILQTQFREFAKRLQLENDWFTQNIPTWLIAFQKNNYDKLTELDCLEVGSWQGLSAVFLLHHFERAKLTCVDTWEGADEHKSDSAKSEVLKKIEQTFDSNLSGYKDRLIKYKGTSYQYFNDNFDNDKFDLIYIDGSHHSDDVVVDAIKAFEMLKVNGLLIFDDYFWKHYARNLDNPCGAINAFMRLKCRQLEIISFNYQLIIRKVSTSVRWLDRN